ncbi:fructosamine kinase family protein [Cryptosporangium aurantiacum]|uniref:Fructosamine-3-kinase n=1 Tax=Cryptosporangium aurantiacum TaxID=134849 RepID=A0A1M7RCI9_9ACTN|nr:fructosamine kinase family protein [Cryptosporangium aurantiacum]SHN44007.1 Fructosamine-3-kinase [Cryptosporangium aurantiacum]
MDLEYLRAHPGTIPRLVEHQRIRITPLGGAKGGRIERWTLDDGTDLFAKVTSEPSDALPAEGRSLRWLAEPGVAAVPEVFTALPEMLVTAWVDGGPATVEGAERFGREVAALHASGAPTFGADTDGVLATLPLRNTPEPDWPTFYVKHRCEPFVRQARDAGALTAAQASTIDAALERVADAAGPPEPPARLHGDLWSGNVLPGRVGDAEGWWMVDPAAYGGHRETDLAMLALFGAPHLDRVLAAYDEATPLAAGWRERVGLHQLHPLLVHCVLFGSGYANRTVAAARSF